MNAVYKLLDYPFGINKSSLLGDVLKNWPPFKESVAKVNPVPKSISAVLVDGQKLIATNFENKKAKVIFKLYARIRQVEGSDQPSMRYTPGLGYKF